MAKLYFKEQQLEEEREKEDKIKGGKTTSRSGQALILPTHSGFRRTGIAMVAKPSVVPVPHTTTSGSDSCGYAI